MVWSKPCFVFVFFFLNLTKTLKNKQKKTFKKVFLVMIESIKSSPDILHSYMNIGTNGKMFVLP